MEHEHKSEKEIGSFPANIANTLANINEHFLAHWIITRVKPKKRFWSDIKERDMMILVGFILVLVLGIRGTRGTSRSGEKRRVMDLMTRGSATGIGASSSLRDAPSVLSDIIREHHVARKTKQEKKRKHIVEKASISKRADIKRLNRAIPDEKHQVVIAVKQKNVEQLEEVLLSVSDPTSASYGHHWSRQQVAAFTSNPEANEQTSSYLTKHGITIVSETTNREYVTAEAPVSVWEELLGAVFFEYHVSGQSKSKSKSILRSKQYTLPQQLHEHVTYMYNIVNFPPRASTTQVRRQVKRSNNKRSNEDSSNFTNIGEMTVQQINSYYNIHNNTGSQLATQAVYESIGQTYSPSDLTIFQEYYSLPVEAAAENIGGHDEDDACDSEGIDNCAEANLDIQYIMGVGQVLHIPYIHLIYTLCTPYIHLIYTLYTPHMHLI